MRRCPSASRCSVAVRAAAMRFAELGAIVEERDPGIADPRAAMDKFYTVIAVLIILEATRRVLGWALPLTALLH